MTATSLYAKLRKYGFSPRESRIFVSASFGGNAFSLPGNTPIILRMRERFRQINLRPVPKVWFRKGALVRYPRKELYMEGKTREEVLAHIHEMLDKHGSFPITSVTRIVSYGVATLEKDADPFVPNVWLKVPGDDPFFSGDQSFNADDLVQVFQ